MTPAQCRAGRALIEMDQNTLAAAASVSRGVVIDFEKGRRTPGANNLTAIRRALESSGIFFVDENGEGAGVRLKKPKPLQKADPDEKYIDDPEAADRLRGDRP